MTTESSDTPGTGASDGLAAAARSALYAGVAADRAAQLAARFDAWLALTTGDGAGTRGAVRLPMLSGSMHPALPRGCTLVIEPLAGGAGADPGRATRPGQVVVFAQDGRLVAHRVLRRAQRGDGTWLLEMGDANRRGRWRPAAEAVGVVVAAELPDGTALPSPCSAARARRLLWRHWTGSLLRRAAPAAGDDAIAGEAIANNPGET